MVEGVWEKGVRKQKVSEKHLCSGQRLKEMYLKKKKGAWRGGWGRSCHTFLKLGKVGRFRGTSWMLD